MASLGYIKRKIARHNEKCARMRAGKAERRLASLTVSDATEGEPSVITLRGPAFGGGHVVELRGRGTDRRGFNLVVDGRPGGTLAVGAVARLMRDVMSTVKHFGTLRRNDLQERFSEVG